MRPLPLALLLLAGCATAPLGYPPPGTCAVRGPGVEHPEPGCVTFVADLAACEDASRAWSYVPFVGGAEWGARAEACMLARGYTRREGVYQAKEMR